MNTCVSYLWVTMRFDTLSREFPQPMSQRIQKIVSITQAVLLAGLIFLLPSNLFLKILPDSGFVHGLQIDYLIPKLYLTDLLIIAILVVELIRLLINQHTQILNGSANSRVQDDKKRKPSVIPIQLYTHSSPLSFALYILPLLFIRQFFTPFPFLAFWQIGKLTVVGVFTYWLVHRFKNHYRHPIFYFLLPLSLLLQSLLGLYQFLTQRSLTPFRWFGETQLLNQPGLARADFSWLDSLIGTNFGLRVLPYGTFPHPNVLAGFLAIGMIVISYQLLVNSIHTSKSKHHQVMVRKILPLTSYILPLFVLFLTQSISAWLTLGVGALFISYQTLRKQWSISNTRRSEIKGLRSRASFLGPLALCLASLAFFITTPLLLSTLQISDPESPVTSVSRRQELNLIAWNMFKAHPLSGVGFFQFTAYVEDYSTSREIVSFVQPTHHVGLLFLAEHGLLGVIILIIGYQIIFTNKRENPASVFLPIIIVLPVLVLDHYLYTLQQGWLMVLLLCLLLPSPKSRLPQ